MFSSKTARGQGGAVGEMAVEAALSDPRALGDLAEGRAEPGFGVDLARGGDERAAIGWSGGGTAVRP